MTEDTADAIALWFISEHTRLPVDGPAYRALVMRLQSVLSADDARAALHGSFDYMAQRVISNTSWEDSEPNPARDIGSSEPKYFTEINYALLHMLIVEELELAAKQARGAIATERDGLIARVNEFADQLLAWGNEDAAAQVRREILTGPVATDQSYRSLSSERAARKRAETALRRIKDVTEDPLVLAYCNEGLGGSNG